MTRFYLIQIREPKLFFECLGDELTQYKFTSVRANARKFDSFTEACAFRDRIFPDAEVVQWIPEFPRKELMK